MRAPAENVTALNPIWAVGRRKAATARVRVFPGGGNVMVNERSMDTYFPIPQDRRTVAESLDLSGTRQKYDVWAKVSGGGATGQAGAVALAIARALLRLEPASERTLRAAGYLRRDARVKERKKYGRRGARRGFQFSKR